MINSGQQLLTGTPVTFESMITVMSNIFRSFALNGSFTYNNVGITEPVTGFQTFIRLCLGPTFTIIVAVIVVKVILKLIKRFSR